MLAQKIGENDYKEFIKKTNLLNASNLQIEEIGKPLNFSWNKCKLETISFGHGIAVTPLQASINLCSNFEWRLFNSTNFDSQ